MSQEMNREQIGQILMSLRKDRGETLSEAAEAIGTSQSAICMYENGARIPRDEIKIKISQHYGVPVESIFFADVQHESCFLEPTRHIVPRIRKDPLSYEI